MRYPRTFVVIFGLVAILLAVSSAEAQRWGRRRYVEPMERDIFPGNAFTFCRIQYDSASRGGRRWGPGWTTDYPEADENLSLRLSQLTTLNVNRTEAGKLKHVTVRLDEEDLFEYPFIYMSEVSGMILSVVEQERLRAYLLRGGFLMVDDFWGDHAWDNWEYEIAQVLPPDEYPIVDIPLDHELFHIVFDVTEVPQVPSIRYYNVWRETGITYEDWFSYDRYGHEPRCRGIFDKNGRLMLVTMHNTDLGDGWEREGVNYEYFKEFSAKKAYPMGINIVVYAMTH